MIVGVPRETFPDETRVALVPTVVASLVSAGFEILIEAGAGDRARFADDAYTEQGASVVSSREEVFARADVVLQVRGFGANAVAGDADLDFVRKGQAIIAFIEPLAAPVAAKNLAERGPTVFAMEFVPRTARAQTMDALSSMATVAGYRAVLLAAEALPKMFPMLMTAAGTLKPANVLVIGAGVAGLQAIATDRRLGAVVTAYDVRPASKEQVESLGARFVDLGLEAGDAEERDGYAKVLDEDAQRRQREALARVSADSDVVITTAAVPGARAPVLISAEAVRGMRGGSVIVDVAAERGGNCELTRPGEVVSQHGVTIVGTMNLAAGAPCHASQMYAKNLSAFLLHLTRDGTLELGMEDEIIRSTLVARDGAVVHPRVLEALGTEASDATHGGNP